MYDPQAKKLNGQSAFKEIVVEISARQLSAKSEALQQMSLFLTQAVFMEVCAHPKPGLVTRHSNGAHTDMSILTFAAGSAVLAKAFTDLQVLGMKHTGDYRELFAKVRQYGVSAEQELLRVTKGVNTQRGILFAGGLMAAAAGAALNKGLDSGLLVLDRGRDDAGSCSERAGRIAGRPAFDGRRKTISDLWHHGYPRGSGSGVSQCTPGRAAGFKGGFCPGGMLERRFDTCFIKFNDCRAGFQCHLARRL